MTKEQKIIQISKEYRWNAMILHDGKMIYEDKNNPVDACYELILKLHEQKLL